MNEFKKESISKIYRMIEARIRQCEAEFEAAEYEAEYTYMRLK